MCKQVKFYDVENSLFHGGILLPSGDVICGCCGAILTKEDFEEKTDFILTKTYNDWIDFTEFIVD